MQPGKLASWISLFVEILDFDLGQELQTATQDIN